MAPYRLMSSLAAAMTSPSAGSVGASSANDGYGDGFRDGR